MNLDNKLEKLNSILKNYSNIGIAFSGGVDSTFLLAAAIKALGTEHVIALTVVPPYAADWEIEEAKDFATQLKVKHIIIETEILEAVKTNPENRCYICKKHLFNTMQEQCINNKVVILADGSNVDDLSDYRPGMVALKELSILSPLLEAGLTKQDIRDLSYRWTLPTWNKPPYACLLTRIPHNRTVTPEVLKRIEQSELALINAGYPFIRVRDHDELARIEIPTSCFEEFIQKGTYSMVTNKLKQLGYRYVTLDLGGYKMGNMNNIGENNG